MGKLKKRLLAFVTSIALVLGFIWIPSVSVAENTNTFSFSFTVTGYDQNSYREVQEQSRVLVTYTIDGQPIEVSFDSSKINNGVINASGDTPQDTPQACVDALNAAILGVGSFDPSTMEAVFVAADGFTGHLEYGTAQGGAVQFTVSQGFDGFPQGQAISFKIISKSNGGGRRPNIGIHMSSSDFEWHGDPAVHEGYFNYQDDDSIIWKCSTMQSYRFCTVSVNDPRDSIDFDDGATQKSMEFTPKANDPSLADVTFSFNWSFRPAFDYVTINGEQYNIPFDFSDKNDWLDHFSFEYQNQDVSFTIENVRLDSAQNGDSLLDIQLDLRPVNMADCHIGNFLWRSEPAEEGSDDCIPHADLELISATYPQNVESGRSFDAATLAAESRLSKSQKSAKYITYGSEDVGGEMVLPAGSKVTMKVAPEFGYQVTTFRVNGQPIASANNASFSTENDVAVFTFTVGYANFHLSADVLQVGNEARTDGAHEVADAGVELSGSEPSMTIGTAKLEVEDAILADGQRELFEDAAEDGFEVTDVIDISLYNTVYKGSAASSWDTPVRTLNNPATIYLALEEDLSDKKVEIIHEKEIGSYEILETEYLEEYNVIAFETTSFSNYAIAVMDDGPGKDAHLVWYESGGKQYWYENGVRQGTVDDPKAVVFDGTVRGREIYDPASDSWYWLDADANGAIAKNKEVFVPYVYQEDKDWSDDDKRRISYESDNSVWDFIYGSMQGNMGKWIRYDENGKMVKGWFTIEGDVLSELYPDQVGNTYYYDNKTGAMVKGETVIDGVEYFFDPTTGVLKK